MTRAAARVAVARQDLGGAADAAPEGFIKCDAANLPAVRPAAPVHLPLRGPSELPVVPDQSPDQDDFAALLGRNRRQRRERRRPELSAGDVRFRQHRRAWQHDAHATLVGRSEQRVTLQVGLGSIRCHDIVLWALFHLDKDGKARAMGKPGLEAKRLENIVDPAFLKLRGEIIGPVAGALLVTDGLACKLIAIAECRNEIFCFRLVGGHAPVTAELLCAGGLDEDILQTGGKADDAVRLTLPRHGDLRAIKIRSRGSDGANTPGQGSCQKYPDNRAVRTEACRDRSGSRCLQIGHDDAFPVPLAPLAKVFELAPQPALRSQVRALCYPSVKSGTYCFVPAAHNLESSLINHRNSR